MKEIKDMSLEEMQLEMQQYVCDKTKGYAFISYSHRDRDVVYPLVLSWMRDGYNIYIDLDFERHGSDSSWVDMMSQTLANRMCHLAICFGSTHYIYSYSALLELLTIRGDMVTRRHNGILPVDYFVLGEISMDNNAVAKLIKEWVVSPGLNSNYYSQDSSIQVRRERFDEMGVERIRRAIEPKKAATAPPPEKEDPVKLREMTPFEDLTAKAEGGDADAQNQVGLMLYRGEVVSRNFEAAVYWYQKAADQGDTLAQLRLGSCYEKGNGVPQDTEKAVYWYQKAAEQGIAFAQCNLGFCYDKGKGVPQDMEKAAYWYQKAADQGQAYAQNNLGNCYYYGNGVPQDTEKAVYWYQKAADQGIAIAQALLGVFYYYGESVPQDTEKAVYWYQKAAEQGQAYAQYLLGNCYCSGKGVPQDTKKAVEWYQKAAEQGYVKAQYDLGNCYYSGKGVPQDLEKAVEWLQKAADRGDIFAKEELKQIQKSSQEG